MTRGIRAIAFIIGILIVFNALLMIAPIILAYSLKTGEVSLFVTTLGLGIGVGGLLVISGYDKKYFLDTRGVYLLIPLSYVLASVYSGIPYMLGPPYMSFTDAFFEAMSGFSTTGATVISDLEDLPKGILLWRSITEWIGGVGVLFLAVLIIPLLNIGGQQLLRMDRSEGLQKSLPRAIAVFVNTITVYIVLTVACFAFYRIFGMSSYDAINHALTTVSTGGFSTHNSSFGYFIFNGIEYVAIVFMIISSFPLPILMLVLNARWKSIFTDEQIRYFIILILVSSITLVFWLKNSTSIEISHTIFNVVSIITGTGYASQNYSNWEPFAVFMFLIFMQLGGCSSSTTGGIKTFRLVIAIKQIYNNVIKIINPKWVDDVYFNQRVLDTSVISLVMVFILIYLFLVLFIALLLMFIGLDAITAFSGASSAIGNIGPGLGDLIGPDSTYTYLPSSAKWILSVGMLLGRVEIFPVIILLYRGLWKY